MTHRLLGLDSETTGLDPHTGDRVIEIGLVELVDRRPTGRVFHTYLNPDRQVAPEAMKVHGLSNEFLVNHPRFHEIVDALLAFIGDAELLIHNAEFDLGFINSELIRSGHGPLDNQVLDTLEYVKRQEPGKRASLDAMADRHGIDRTQRTLHGALVDAHLLCDVYIAMTREQSSLMLRQQCAPKMSQDDDIDWLSWAAQLKAAEPTQDELKAHADYISALNVETKGKCVWRIG